MDGEDASMRFGAQQAGFVTPRSVRSIPAMEQGMRPPSTGWPSWMSRIGEMFKAPPVTWLPSPMPSPPRPRRLLEARSLYGPPPRRHRGGPEEAAGIRGEEQSNLGLGPTLHTPSSSSIPAEAIQAEVQRQLGGLLERLQAAESTNTRLQEELARAQAMAARRDQQSSMLGAAPHGDLGHLPVAYPEPRADLQGRCGGDRERVQDQECQPSGQGDDQQARPDPWSDPLGALWEEIQLRRGAQQSASDPVTEPARTQGDDAQRAGGGTETATAAILEALTKNLVSMQEMQMKAMKRDLEDGDTPEQVKSSVVSLPALVGPEDASAAILFQDWLAQVNVPMQDLSASSGSWWKDVMKLVQDTYGKWLASTPIERLQLEPIGHERLTSLKWTRVNSRACSLILQCLTEGVKADLIARRAVQSTPMTLFRLHTAYQPGGASERAAVLTNLQQPSTPTSLDGSLSWLRSWPRWMQRCKDLNMTTPDGSVLAKALTVVTARFIGENADTQFRTQLMRSSLRIDAQPTVTDVMKYHQHLQAEIESLMSARALSASPGPAVKNVSAVNSPSAPSTGQGSQKQPCKYFVKASGCRRGQKCPYLHDWATMNKAERARRCLVCGGEDHRQKDCPTKAPRQTPKGGAVSQNPTAATSSSPTERTPKVQSLEPDSEASPTAQVPVVASEPVWTLESLIQAAAKVAGASGQAPKAPSINVLAIRHKSGAEPGLTSYALVDSGATHALRRASDQNEWDEADPVIVNLAGGESVGLRMNKAGTILVQPTSLTSATSTAPIVPLGALVSQLGYMMVWTKNRCRLEGPNGEIINLKVKDGCPELTEHQALELISRLEDSRLEQLRANTADTRSRVRAAALAMNRTWFDHLLSYVDSEFSSEGFKAIEAAPFLDGIPRPCLTGIFDSVPESNGWDVLRGLKHLNRKTRKRLWSSNSWIVHLFAGDRPKKDMYHLENHGHVVLELDIARGRSQNILDQAVWRVLEWAARKGKIAGIVGGPPQGSFMISRHIVGGPEPLRSNEYPYGNWDGQSAADVYEVNRHTSLYVRMIMLHAIATAGKIRHPGDPSTTKEVAFMLEQPRDPRGYLAFQDPLYPDVVSFWRTPLWMEYALEAGLHTHSFDLAAFGKSFTRFTTIGTNLPMQHLNGLRARFHTDGPISEKSPPRVWPPEFYENLLIALVKWFQVPRMLRMSAEQWKEHVQRGHLPFRPDCAVCVQAGATGRRHSRVEHPTAFVLSADLSGPVKVGGVDPDGRGAFPKQFKYIFAAKLRVPRSFVEDGRGVWLAYDTGELSTEDYEAADDGLAPEESQPRPEPRPEGNRDGEDEEDVPPEGGKRTAEDDLDLAGPELVNLIFSCGLKDDKATTVLEAVQDVVLYCRSLNIPILRFHSDRGMEFRARATRQWLKNEGIRVTSSEPGVHQTNGAAEATIRWLKQRARTLLLAAGLPQHLWASAMSAAATMQRSDVLGFEPKFAAPYGAKVMVRKRHMEGPKQEDLAPKWVSGVYVGLSDSVSRGHLVYVKDDDGEKFIHTLHVRAGLHDPGPIAEEYVAEFPDPPDRRLRGKAAGSGDVVGVSKAQLIDELEWKQRADELLRRWSQEEAESLVIEVARNVSLEEAKYGMFRHGGKLGITRATVERPWFARVLNKVFKEKVPDAEYAAVFVSMNNEREVHIDRNNAVGMVNHILPLLMPRRGGELWMELRDGDVVSGKVLELTSPDGRTRYGCAYALQEGRVFSFDPHRRHAVLPWTGERIAIIGYTPGLFASLQRAAREVLRDLQFPLPLEEEEGANISRVSIRTLSAVPVEKKRTFEEEPLKGGGWSEVIPTSDGDYLFKCDWSISRRERRVASNPTSSTTTVGDGHMPVTQEEWDDWEMKLVLEDNSSSSTTATIAQGSGQQPAVRKAEVAYTLGIEKLLGELSAPLSIVHTVHPGEAANCLEQWIPAIAKEANSLEHAVDKVFDNDTEVIQDLQSGNAEVMPMKLVFTVKPPDADAKDLYKRKARIVICAEPSNTFPGRRLCFNSSCRSSSRCYCFGHVFQLGFRHDRHCGGFLTDTFVCGQGGAEGVWQPPQTVDQGRHL